jgi:hypothetical protein
MRNVFFTRYCKRRRRFLSFGNIGRNWGLSYTRTMQSLAEDAIGKRLA